MTHNELNPAYVIHTRSYRDTSLIVEIFTPAQGRMSLLARGAKAGKAKKSLLLQPFRKLHVSWAGRGDLPVLAAVEEAGESIRLQGEALACGYYVNELIYHLLPRHESAAELFVLYWPVIESITDPSSRDHALRQFEFTLLQQTGYAPMLGYEVETGAAVDPQQRYRYHIPEGPVTAASEEGLVISGKTLLELDQQQYEQLSYMKEARDLARALLHYQLNGRELLSRTLFTSMHKVREASSEK